MDFEDSLSPEDRARWEDFRKNYWKKLAERPEMSDEEFMAETEASDEEYEMGVTLPGIG